MTDDIKDKSEEFIPEEFEKKIRALAVATSEEAIVSILTDIFMSEQKRIFNKVMEIGNKLGVHVGKSLVAADFEQGLRSMMGVAANGELSNLKSRNPDPVQNSDEFYTKCFIPAREKFVLFIRDELLSKEAGMAMSEMSRNAMLNTMKEIAEKESKENVKH